MRGDGLPGVQDKHIRRKAGQLPSTCKAYPAGAPAHSHAAGPAVRGGMHALAWQIHQQMYSSCGLHREVLGVHQQTCAHHTLQSLCQHVYPQPCHPAPPPPHTHTPSGIDVSSIKNKGVEAREARDRAAAVKATGTGPERLAESAAALERKAALYERLAAQGGAGDDEQDDKYEVGWQGTNTTEPAAILRRWRGLGHVWYTSRL
jgi:hypothetical protein